MSTPEPQGPTVEAGGSAAPAVGMPTTEVEADSSPTTESSPLADSVPAADDAEPRSS